MAALLSQARPVLARRERRQRLRVQQVSGERVLREEQTARLASQLEALARQTQRRPALVFRQVEWQASRLRPVLPAPRMRREEPLRARSTSVACHRLRRRLAAEWWRPYL